MSKFGSLAEVCADDPGAFLRTDEAREEEALDPADLATVERALAELGYVSAPEELLESDYEGPSRLEPFAAPVRATGDIPFGGVIVRHTSWYLIVMARHMCRQSGDFYVVATPITPADPLDRSPDLRIHRESRRHQSHRDHHRVVRQLIRSRL